LVLHAHPNLDTERLVFRSFNGGILPDLPSAVMLPSANSMMRHIHLAATWMMRYFFLSEKTGEVAEWPKAAVC
jgi:hypothetical protein